MRMVGKPEWSHVIRFVTCIQNQSGEKPRKVLFVFVSVIVIYGLHQMKL